MLYQSGAPIDGYEGKETMLLTPNGKLPAKYRLVEVADLIPSHDPITFAVNAKYPKGVQERAYDKSKEAQARVIDHAQNYEPSYTVNTNPDAINGPPVVTPNGTVLGGNSRTMSTVRLYRDGNGDVYRNMLRTKAAEYGLKPEDVEGMKEPILVRQVDEPRSVDAMLESLQGERAFVGRGEISLVVLQFIKRLANLPAENWLEFEGIWLAGELSPVVLPGGKQRYCGENYRRLERYLYGIDNNGWNAIYMVLIIIDFMAERVGFEPTLELPLNTLSKRAPSATRPSLPDGVYWLNLSQTAIESAGLQQCIGNSIGSTQAMERAAGAAEAGRTVVSRS